MTQNSTGIKLNLLLLLLAPLLLLAIIVRPAFAVTVAPGVDATLALSPTSGTGVTTVTRTITLTNSNVDTPKTLTFTGTIRDGAGNSTPVTGTYTTTVPGARGPYMVDLAIPVGATYIAGSRQINGIAQPDLTIANGFYTVTVSLPAGTATTPTKTILVDQLKVDPTTIAAGPVTIINDIASLNKNTLWALGGMVLGINLDGRASAMPPYQFIADGSILAMNPIWEKHSDGNWIMKK